MQYTGMRVKMKSAKNGYDAQGLFDGKGVTILAGSRVNIDLNQISPPLIELRRFYVDSDGVVQNNLYLESPSTAARFVIGRAANGWVEWKFENGENLDAYRKKRIDSKQRDKNAAPRQEVPRVEKVESRPVVSKQEVSIVTERERPASRTEQAAIPPFSKDKDVADLMRQVAQLREMVLSKQNEAPRAAHENEIRDRRFRIAIQHRDAPELRLSQTPAPIRNLSFNLSFDCAGEKGQVGKYRLFFLNDEYEVVSNQLEFDAKSGMGINGHFTLASGMSKRKLCYLGIQDIRDAQDELQRLIPFDIQILFEADFDF